MSEDPTDRALTAGPWRRILLALCTSGLVVLALPTLEFAPVGLIAWAPLLYALQNNTPMPLSRRQRFWLGLLAGFVYQLVLFRWIPFTLTEMTPFPAALTWVMCVLYALWHGLQIALFAVLLPGFLRVVASRLPSFMPLAMAASFAVVEWAFPALFPWSYGHTIWEVGPLAAPLLSFQGVPLMTLWVLLPSALIAHALTRPVALRKAVFVTVSLLIGLPAAGAGLRALTLGDTGRVLDIAVVQPNYVLAEKKKANRAMRELLLERLEAQIATLPRGELDLVVASEGAFPLWWRLDAGPLSSATPREKNDPMLGFTRRIQKAVATGPGTHTILGGLRHDEDGETRNAAVHLGPDGTILGHYDKQTLVPFSEYVPLAGLFPALKEIRGIGHMIAGDKPCQFQAGVPITCGICYESMFAGPTRDDAGSARVLVNLTIDTWFGTSTAPRMHLMSHASRAAELGIPLLRAGLTGISAIIGPDGQVVSSLPLDTPGILRATIPVTNGTTLYRAVGQVLMPLIGLLLLLQLLGDSKLVRRVLATRPAKQKGPG